MCTIIVLRHLSHVQPFNSFNYVPRQLGCPVLRTFRRNVSSWESGAKGGHSGLVHSHQGHVRSRSRGESVPCHRHSGLVLAGGRCGVPRGPQGLTPSQDGKLLRAQWTLQSLEIQEGSLGPGLQDRQDSLRRLLVPAVMRTNRYLRPEYLFPKRSITSGP